MATVTRVLQVLTGQEGGRRCGLRTLAVAMFVAPLGGVALLGIMLALVPCR